ncbi:MAG: ankyrin repeat domain-containing protein [Gammaproteobacteria bacterium]|nr:ankyrin repeat domain-containing protein [Gammaproteobacteria bacterium]MDE0259295.1 ankyrin repeat domain-containing protein [Gammaproteobacteria bacterium]
MGSPRGRARLLGMAIVPLLLLGGGWSDAPVADAAARGDLEAVRRLLREGADVNAPQGDGMTALHWAAERGDAELADVLLYAGARVDAGTRIGHYTPLHLASRRARATVVEVLLDAGSDPNASTTNSGATPLHLAAATGDPAVVEVLVEAGADVNGREGAWGQTPLIFAAASNRVAALEVLLGAGADLSLAAWSVDVAERERADAAADRRLNEFLADFKEKEGGGPEWQPTPSQVQAAIEASREIQRRWPDVPDPANDGRTMANQEGQIEAEEEGEGEESGTEADAASEAEEDSGEPAESGEADEASEEAEGDEEESTDDEGDEDESADDEDGDPRPDEEPRPMSYAQMVGAWGGLTPLLHAIRQGHVEATLTLLEAGAEINQVSEGDQTSPLLMASVNGQFDLALTLLERGADPNLASQAGTTPLFAVLERQWAPRASYAHPTEHLQQNATHLEVLDALLEAGADPNARLKAHLWFMEYTFGVLRGSGINLQGATPFWRAAYALDVDAMRLLKEHGADPGIPTMKPPQRRRRRPPPPPEPAPAEEAVVEAGEGEAVEGEEAEGESETETPASEEPATEAAGAEAEGPGLANAEGETDEEEEEPAQQGYGRGDDDDLSGVPSVPTGGPAIYPIHAASGVGYGQSFAGNAHRYVPDNWLAAVKFLVEEANADVNVRDANAYTALHHAASRGDDELVLYLVEHGADVTVLSRRGQTTADMANGPVQRVQPFPSTIALLERLGSKNNNNCVSC